MAPDELYDFWRQCQRIDKRVTPAAAAALARRFLAAKREAARRGPAH